ncbi:hypothetical protein FB567DRAFT_596050 [Paraphoma chrysanthemicola]|uniref:Uncharacterized protein n=1 Tax=Paraphoma chrysanthemicola TaxID=798071 RepID=A0A8K0VUR8_9PLEO|nr:hypothetical protein FB567DRAFT_596050 [Paraphoma chrysanthemicola]
MAILCHLPNRVDSSITEGGERQGAEVVSTQVLQEPKDGKPAITLTTYKNQRSESLSQLFKPINPSPFAAAEMSSADLFSSRAEHYVNDSEICASGSEEGLNGLEILSNELDDHFRSLRGEFEERTGRAWVPLTPWEPEEPEQDWEWAWESSGEVGAEPLGMDG